MRLLALFCIKFILVFIVYHVNAQQAGLPHQMTVTEQRTMAEYLRKHYNNSLRSVPNPPPGSVRTIAEWEPIQALIITWSGQQAILREIVRNAVKECRVLIITTSPSTVSNSLTEAGIPLDSVEFVNTPFNSIWVRDYGPWGVYSNDVDSLALVDWIYNRPRQNDDASPLAVADHLQIPVYEATTPPFDWVHTGGNHLLDGMGTVFSSRLVLDENPGKTETQIDSIAHVFLGVNKYIKFPTLPFDGIHHLDMHMCMLDEETILFGQYPEGISDGPQIESNIHYLLDSFQTVFGQQYNIIRMPMPPDGNGRYPNQGGNYRTYTNSIFLNKTILVPTYQEKYDTTALRIYRENLPGYNVVGINCNAIIPQLGALHCITKTVGVEDPLWIAHSRLRDTDDPQRAHLVTATIKHRSGIADAELYYRLLPDSMYTMVPMVLVDTTLHQWAALIPPQVAGAEVQYYIHAYANSGKEQVRPIVAPEGYFRFRIHGEIPNQPPLVDIVQPEDESVFSIAQTSVFIQFDASDADGQVEVTRIFVNGEEVAVVDTLPYEFTWSFPAEGAYDIVVEATDDDGAITFSDTVRIHVEGNTSIDDLLFDDKYKLYPNPVEDLLFMTLEDISIHPGDIHVFNALGQSQSVITEITGQMVNMDFTSLPAGVYVVKIGGGSDGNGYRVIKI